MVLTLLEYHRMLLVEHHKIHWIDPQPIHPPDPFCKKKYQLNSTVLKPSPGLSDLKEQNTLEDFIKTKK